MRRVILRSAIAAIAVVALAGGARAQDPELPPPVMTPAQVQDLFDAMIVMQAQDALTLSEQQYAQFLTRLRVLQQARRRHQQQRVRLINELQRLTNPRNAQRPAASEPEIRDRLRDLQELEARAAAETRKAYTGIDEVLDVRQQARFRVFEEQMERRKLDLIARARQNNRPANSNRQAPAPRRPPGR